MLLESGNVGVNRCYGGGRTVVKISGDHRFRQAHGFCQQRDALLTLALGQRIGLREGIQHLLNKCAIFSA